NDITPGVTDSQVMMKLKELYVEQQAKLIEMKGKYLDKHPTVMAQEARVEALRNDLKREAHLAQKNVEAQYGTLVKQEKDLRTALDAVTREALQLEQRAIDYNRLKRNYDRLAKLSDQVGGRERETSLAGHLKTNNVSLLDAATVPTMSIAPNVPRAVGSAFAFGLLLAIGLALFLELLDTTVKTQEDVEKNVGLSFLGLIPTIQDEGNGKGATAAIPPPKALEDAVRKGAGKDLYVLMHPKSSVAECCRSIRTNLIFTTPDHPARTILITSAGPQEGKTTTAISLATTMAQSGLRVLLVDTDMRRPRLHKTFGIPSTGNGVSKAIVTSIDASTMVVESGIPGLWLLPCGMTPPNPAELLHAERFRRIIAELSERFDRVIFDSPPIGAVTDAAILARLVDGVVLIAKGGSTRREALRRALYQLGVANVLGCILNDLDLTRQGTYGYYYYYSKYGGYYEDESQSPAVKESSGG
ncbi:MAG: wzc2, partial [bacterium]|nr:wzc2 [bacterium]